nr:MAG TPA: hypothetical protein [Caudoviricetes sp.]
MIPRMIDESMWPIEAGTVNRRKAKQRKKKELNHE